MRLVAPFGFYGWGNIGDESTLQGFARLVSRRNDGTQVWVASRNPSHTAKVEPSFRYYEALGQAPRRWWARFRATAAVIAGGTPIMDVFGEWPLKEVASLVASVTDARKPFAFVGCGTESLQREESRRLVAGLLAPRVRHWTVRSERDKERLDGYGVAPERVTIAADMAWLVDPVTAEFGRSYLPTMGVKLDGVTVGVNVNMEAWVRERQPRLLKILAEFLDRLIEEHDAEVLFLCNEVRNGDTFDAAASRELISSMRHPDRGILVPNQYWTPQQMLSMIACCSLTVSTRYHFCLFSALQGVPFIGLKRSDKVDDLCRDLEWPYAALLADLDASSLLEAFARMNAAREALASDLRQRAGRMRGRALANGVALDAVR